MDELEPRSHFGGSHLERSVLPLEQRRAETQIVGFLLTDGLMEAQGPMPGGHIDATPQPR